MTTPKFDVSDIIQLISAHSDDISTLCSEADLSWREANAVSPEDWSAELLDALVFFLKTIPEGGQHFALTLSTTAQGVVATVVSNSSQSIVDSCGHDVTSPHTTLQTIWNLMKDRCNAPPENKHEASMKLARYLLGLHNPILVHRFEKGHAEFEQFRKKARGVPRSHTFDDVAFYLESVDGFYEAVRTFCTNPISDDSVARLIEQRHKFKDPLPQMAESRAPFPKTVAKFTAETRTEGSTFDLIQFVEKLRLPVVHFLTIAAFCRDRHNRALMQLGLHIHTVTTKDCTTVGEVTRDPKEWLLDEQKVESFLRFIHSVKPYTDLDNADKAYPALAQQLVQNMRNGKYRQVTEPHPECALIQHHYNTPHIVPWQYIATTKPPCFECETFLQSCQYVSSNLRFSVRRWSSRVQPCLLPTMGDLNEPITTTAMDFLSVPFNTIIDKAMIHAYQLYTTPEAEHPAGSADLDGDSADEDEDSAADDD